ncbi:DnaD domain protein [Weissella confusa]|uniref:DnaD domain-containing protein n=1 Tax=Weissella confusa TaxID=1583 RepID=UPI001681693F|nr:DnaD domain protein [Weissella confusa]MBD1491600.1 DnaD domain protein [Weissella confusa]MBJ7663613.1 DnaD domain protein [Weissella confusa]MCS9990778.1 DnaD domain protein [Weissella confusa]MCT0009557.1 DnaD domain protein [Weissella confusa]MCT0024303.1 DnaD domain protein [Weissella confusa]
MTDKLNFAAFMQSGTTSISNYLLQHYRDLGMTNEELLVYVQTKAGIDRGELEPSTQKIGETLGWDAQTVFGHLEAMRAKGLVNFVSMRDGAGRVSTQLDFQPLYDKLVSEPGSDTMTAAQRVATQGQPVTHQDDLSRAAIYNLIEQEFGRPLSQMEMETVKNWFDVDHFKPEFIKAAVQEAVLNAALNLRYIETILVAWQKKNYRSVQEVRQERQKRTQFKQLNSDEKVNIPTNVDILNTDWSKFK